jgi:hypothetical protein
VVVFDDKEELEAKLADNQGINAVVMMSSGNFSGIDLGGLFASY